MLTKLIVRRFKQFADIEIELGSPVVFVGPNNSGKTTALQALALWDLGLRRWKEKRRNGKVLEISDVTINRAEVFAALVPDTKLLWQNTHTNESELLDSDSEGWDIDIQIIVEGATEKRTWKYGMVFSHANSESFYCRPDESDPQSPIQVPDDVTRHQVVMLPPMSGLADREFVKERGEIDVLIGQGRTAEVLRNLAYQLSSKHPELWASVIKRISSMFGVSLLPPSYTPERGELTMTYEDQNGTELDISCSGTGFRQTLLLLCYLAANPGCVLLLDEPDAHLEILRQREIYNVLCEAADEHGSQLVIASHSEVVLNEAAGRHLVIAFLGDPHRINDRGTQLRKALQQISFDDYYLAAKAGWALYVEGATDLSILRSFAQILSHPVLESLKQAFVRYVGNQPQRARAHFQGLREAKANLYGMFLCDRIDGELKPSVYFDEYAWKRREIENYLFQPETLIAYARHSAEKSAAGPLFTSEEVDLRVSVMQECIKGRYPPIALQDRNDSFWKNTKATDDILDPLFKSYFEKLHLPNLMRKTDYHELTKFVPRELIDDEITTVLDKIHAVAMHSTPNS